MGKDKKTFDVIAGGKPDGEAYEKEDPTPMKEFSESIAPGTKRSPSPGRRRGDQAGLG